MSSAAITGSLVGNRVLANKGFLERVARTTSARKRRRYIEEASAEELLAIVESCFNVLRARLPLSRRQRARLAEHADHIRRISRVRTERSARRPFQGGDGIAIATLLIPVLAEAARAIISSTSGV